MLLSVAKDAYLNYCSKTTHYAQNYLHNWFIVFLSCYFFKILPAKPLGCFVRENTGHAHLPNDEIRIPWRPMRPSTLFFGCRMHEKSTRKDGFKVWGWSLHPVFDWERNTPSKESLPVCECNIGLYCLYTGCFQASSKGLLTWVWKDKQIYIYTYIS